MNINPLGERLIDVIMEDYGENHKINFTQFIFLLAKFRQGKIKSSITDFNSRESKLRFLFDVSEGRKYNHRKAFLYYFIRCMIEIMIWNGTSKLRFLGKETILLSFSFWILVEDVEIRKYYWMNEYFLLKK